MKTKSSVLATIIIVLTILISTQEATARILSTQEMQRIVGRELNCNGVTEDKETCKESDPCKDCVMTTSGDPSSCPNYNSVKNVYPGITLHVCCNSGNPPPWGTCDRTSKDNCYRPYMCTQGNPIENMKCGETKKCSTYESGYKCRECYTGTSQGDWITKVDEKCNS